MLTRPVSGAGGSGVCNWSKTGSDIYYTAGKVGIGISAPTRDLHVVGWNQFSLTRQTYSAGNPNDQMMVWSDFNGIQHPSGGLGYLGATLEVVNYHTANGATKPVGTSNGLVALTWIKANGDSQSEATPFWCGLTSDDGGRLWGTDQCVLGPKQTQTQCNLLLGASMVINRYNSSAINSGSCGHVITTKPGAGGMSVFTGRGGATTYPIDIGLAVIGYSSGGANNVGFTTGIQVGGYAGGWNYAYDTTSIGTGIKVFDWINYGIHISGRHAAATGPDIKCTGIIQIGDYASITPGDGMIKYNAIGGFQGYAGGAWSQLGGGGVNAFDGGAFMDTYVDTVNFDGGAFV